MLVSRLAVGCPLRSTLVMSRGGESIALRGGIGVGAAAGLFAFPLVDDLARVDVGILFVPLAGEARMVELEAVVEVGT